MLFVVLSLLAACGVEAGSALKKPGDPVDGGTKTDQGTTTTKPVELLPPVDLPVAGSNDSKYNEIATTAISDLEKWWAKQFPTIYPDKRFRPLSGGLFAYDSSTDPSTLPCNVRRIRDAMYNAFYCPSDDAVAWDQETLMPDLAAKYGDFTVAVVLAHEWGHMVQNRSEYDERTVFSELQADCFAGAWVAHVRNDQPSHFEVTNETVDKAMAGILSLKDRPGGSAEDEQAHGSGFDRVGALQDGFENSVTSCAKYGPRTITPYLFEWRDTEEAEEGGNMELSGADGIETKAFESLDGFWEENFPKISGGKAWKDLSSPESFDESDPPTCNGKEVKGYRLFLCSSDRYVGYANDTVKDAYDLGDFAVGTLFGTQYGLEVQVQLGQDVSKDPVTATLQGDCYSGAWAAGLLRDKNGEVPEKYVLSLSPGDLDEAVAVLLTFRTDSDRERQGPGFQRVKAFRIGVTKGVESCADVKASS